MPSLDFESDQLLQLLTDALRAGPGSPQWHEAVGRLRAGGQEMDEYRLLCDARERLESGKEYRAVRAGPGFTRRVMAGVDEAAEQSKAPPTANIIAIASAILIVIVLAIVGFILMRSAEQPARNLADTYFGSPVISSTFDVSLGPDWRTVGSLPLTFANGLRPGASGDDYQGGGIVTENPIQPDQAVAMEVAVRVQRVSADVAVQVFVTDEPQFSEDRATSTHELVWWVQEGRQQVVLPNGRVGTKDLKIQPGREPILVRITIDRDNAIINSGGKQLWEGLHQLDPAKPRYFGVRFLRRGPDRNDIVSVQSIRLLKPEKK